MRCRYKGEQSDRETWTDWKSGLARRVWSLTETNAESCTWVRITKEHRTVSRVCVVRNSLTERDLGFLVDKNMNLSWECAAAAAKVNQILGCIHGSITSRERDVIVPLSSFQAACGVLCPVLVPTF